MRLLLDTHALLWILAESAKLSPAAARAYRDPANDIFVSAASLWEIGIKISLGKLSLQEGWPAIVSKELEANGVRWLAIGLEHCAGVATLPFHHRDPFDRLLIAQAKAEGMTLLTADQAFAAYGVEVLW